MRLFISALLATRIIFDGQFSFNLWGKPFNGYLAILTLIVGVFVVLSGRAAVSGRSVAFSIFIVGLSLGASVQWGGSVLDEAIRLISLVTLSALSYTWGLPFSQKQLVVLFGSLSGLNFAFAVAQAVTGSGLLVGGVSRFSGFMAHPNSAALVYGITIILVLQSLTTGQARVFSIVALLFALAGLGITLSIGGTVSVLAGVGLALLQTRSQVSKLGKLVVGIIFVAGLALVAIYVPGVATRFNMVTDSYTYVNADATNSLVWRFQHWAQLWPYVVEHPIFGMGLGSSATGQFTPDGLMPHSEYLRLLLETGVIGGLIAIWAIRRTIRTHLKVINSNHGQKWASQATLSVLAALLINCLTENTFIYTVPIMMFCVLLGQANRQSKELLLSASSSLRR